MTQALVSPSWRPWWLAGLMAAVTLTNGCGTNTSTQTPSPGPDPMNRAIPAVVMIVGYRNGVPAFAGSGTIISRNGLIVTNAHVGKPDADGLAVQYPSPFIDDPVDKLEVYFTVSPDQPPEARYLASLVAADGYLDAAILRITADLHNAPVSPASLDLPFVSVGDSDKLELFDPLHVVGFPGIGGDTVSAAPGEVSGFVEDCKIGSRGWIKTSALIYHGNSGGMAANAAGELIGIPTRLPDFAATDLPGGYNLIRPINLVKPLIASAIAGQTPTSSKYLTHGSGNEQLIQIGWTSAEDEGCGLNPPLTSYPTGTTSIWGVFHWTGMTMGEDILYALIGAHAGKDRKPDLVSLIARSWNDTANSTGGCRTARFTYSDGWPDDTYILTAEVDSQRRQTSKMQVVVGGQPAPVDGVLLNGRIVSSTTGAGVAGVMIYVLNEGVDAHSWINAKSDSDVAASTVTDANGAYVMPTAVIKGKTYPLVILTSGYQPWVGTLGPIKAPMSATGHQLSRADDMGGFGGILLGSIGANTSNARGIASAPGTAPGARLGRPACGPSERHRHLPLRSELPSLVQSQRRRVTAPWSASYLRPIRQLRGRRARRGRSGPR